MTFLDIAHAPVDVPIATPFVHAGKARATTESVLVRASALGETGWGEAAPRPYVTGESVASVRRALDRFDADSFSLQIDWDDFETAIASLSAIRLDELLPGAPTAGCAVELAVLDLIGRLYRRPAAAALRVPTEPFTALLTRQTRVSAALVIDLSGDVPARLGALSPTTRARIVHVKVKASADPVLSVERLRQVRDFFPDTSLSVDVNGAWDTTAVRTVLPDLVEARAAWLEEPVSARDWETMAAIRREFGIPIMLDESFSTIADAEEAVRLGAADLVNLRISKCGGVFASLRSLWACRELGLGAQLGVQVAEVGPLAAAGRLLATAVAGFRSVEAGRHDEWFPEPLTQPPITVDREMYTFEPPAGFGLGLQPTPRLLSSLEFATVPRRERAPLP